MGESEQRLASRLNGSARTTLREALITGTAIVVPFLITVLVLGYALTQIQRVLVPVSGVVVNLTPIEQALLVQVLAPVLLVAYILFVGFIFNHTTVGELAVDYFDAAMSQVPGVGSVYDSFRQMGDIVMDSDGQNFREVKLVEFPHEGAYTLGFVTTETPRSLQEPTGEGPMVTMFLPLAPNPVMGGHLVHMPKDKVLDVDMTVEEGVRAIVTSGVAVGGANPQTGEVGLSQSQMRELARIERVDQQLNPEQSAREHPEDPVEDMAAAYERRVDPESARTPEDIERRQPDAGTVDRPGTTPAAAADRPETARGETGAPPAEAAERSASDRDGTAARPAEVADRSAGARDDTEVRPAERAGTDPGPTDDAGSLDTPPAELADGSESDRTDIRSGSAEDEE